MKIIIIEDDKDIRDALQEALELENYQVEAFPNAPLALAYLKQQQTPCLILLDLFMPIMNGIDFMLQLAKLKLTLLPIPVYFISAAKEPGVSTPGVLGFIKKPIDLNLLLAIVKKHCNGER